ncbi:hypothetical protein [Minwuia sp.]|uniref:hypothetical protein n=1 Tax=Minwuia sp. TaxID=2493630 RepID=UPI003A8C8BD4
MSDPEIWLKFDELGEEAVRKRIVMKAYAGRNLVAAQEWLRSQEASRNDADSFEQRRIARSAKNAAWTAAIAAMIAAIAAVVAIVLSLP